MRRFSTFYGQFEIYPGLMKTFEFLSQHKIPAPKELYEMNALVYQLQRSRKRHRLVVA